MSVVVDTNVAIAANGRDTHASIECQYRCVDFLESIATGQRHDAVVLDDTDLILSEYRVHLKYRGQPGVGDMFFKYLHDHMYGSSRVQLVPITCIEDETRGFGELPINTVDISDRKFLAAAVVSNSDVVNAMDSDWDEQRDFIAGLGLRVIQLCPEHAGGDL